MPSDLPIFRSSTSSHPVLDDILPNGPTSAPNLGAAAEDDGSPEPGLRKEADTLDPHLANRAVHPNTFVTLDPPPQSPSLALVTESGVAIASASFKEPNAEQTGYHPPDPLHGLHEIV
ncbi:hypothetical protein BJY52DRAFT_1227452 [Lactarius psammicola]|nr:hypothetical protein BJY52DRAFT_1227452 [Lactarius psammicola]